MKNQKGFRINATIHEKEAIRIISCTETLRALPVWGSFFVKLEIESTKEAFKAYEQWMNAEQGI